MFVAAAAAMQLLVSAGQRGGETLLDNPWLSGTAFLSATSAAAAAAVGAVAPRKGERTMTVTAVVAIGALLTLFVTVELLIVPD